MFLVVLKFQRWFELFWIGNNVDREIQFVEVFVCNRELSIIKCRYFYQFC